MTSPAPDAGRTISRFSLGIAGFSTIVEWYDFTLYLYLTTVLGRVIFGGGQGGVAFALLGFAISYVMRPVGAMFFGHLGDRFGRKVMMLASMSLMTLAMFVTACLPTHASVGALAGWLMLLLRLVMAFSVGGEYTGVVAYLMDGSPADRRGLIASLAAAASEIGALLAAGVTAMVVQLLPTPSLDAWGWRIPFLVGAAMAGAVLMARSTMEESPEFENLEEVSTNPLGDTLRTQFPSIARTFAISALGSITYYVGISYVPTYLAGVARFSESDALWLSTIAAFAVILVTPLAGAASDRFGRRPTLIVNALLAVVLPLTMFAFMGTGSPARALVGAIVLAIVAGGVSAIAASATPEQFATRGRLSGLALGVTMATAIFGGLTPWLAEVLTRTTGWAAAPGAMIDVVALCVLPVLWWMPETAPAKSPPL